MKSPYAFFRSGAWTVMRVLCLALAYGAMLPPLQAQSLATAPAVGGGIPRQVTAGDSMPQAAAAAAPVRPDVEASARLAGALPPIAQVKPWVAQHPAVRSAQSTAEADRTRADIVEQGATEVTAHLSQQRRQVLDTAEQYQETLLSLERPFRWWGKAGIDADIAGKGRAAADWALGDAWHETSRLLLTLWLDLARETQRVELARTQQGLAQDLYRQAAGRLRRGDVSALDASLAQAELQRMQANLGLALAGEAAARARLLRAFPGAQDGLPAGGQTAAWPSLEVLQQAIEALPPWTRLLEDYRDHNHGLQLARVGVERQRLLAQRADRDRYPDPTLGVFAANERGGNERIVGVSISVPLSGGWRQSQSLAAQADARSAEERLAQTDAVLAADFEARHATLRPQLEAARALDDAARTQALAADKSLHAYQLGEHSMTELVQNRRLAADQRSAAESARLDAFEGVALIYLDLHMLWDFDE